MDKITPGDVRACIVMAALAALAIAGGYGLAAPWLHYATKPAATLVAVAIAARAPHADAVYRRALVAGLLASTAGDVFLMLDPRWFGAGLGSFLVAHLCYLRAFLRGTAGRQPRWPYAAYALPAAGLLAALWSSVPAALKGAVVVYVAALSVMAAQALVRALARGDGPSRRAALGGACFVVSDAVLAWDRFRDPFPAALGLVLAMYWIAQALIALSVRGSQSGARSTP